MYYPTTLITKLSPLILLRCEFSFPHLYPPLPEGGGGLRRGGKISDPYQGGW